MWKDELPKNCPPKKAFEKETEVYRILSEETPSVEDFRNYCYLNPENERYKELCKAYALSFFNSKENALNAIQRSSNLQGKFIGEYKLNKSHGVCELNSRNGHYSVWFYDSWKFEDFSPTQVIKIDGDR
ncbi:hypothetical protein KJK34_11840 [Flavobacterium sp. D11R37]|uniref:hypothetical protein n=1 Tax=Flavobacterium coralii TaxID=2838017 RepID=UPI001CA5F4AF|nr:hypothetical protein [Flavobacterium coralii]MBY8963446.1 hypothetical protein [Flavobacterium coralii]